MKFDAPGDVNLDQYDDVFVVSDLHLGGVDAQLFDQGREFQDWVTNVVMKRLNKVRKVAIVINGDFVDFLAEPKATYFNPEAAIPALHRISRDKAFKPVFDAIHRFLSHKNATVVITLGNHDLELVVANVGANLKSILARNDSRLEKRIKLELGPKGYLCRVGSKRVWCVHGNGADVWNNVDWKELDVQAATWADRKHDVRWVPNAGTKLVIEVMNPLKPRYRFIDILKPEDETIVPVLLAIEPSLITKMLKVLGSLGRVGLDSIRNMHLLSDQDRRKLLKQKRHAQKQLGRARLLRILDRTSDGSDFLATMESPATLIRAAHSRVLANQSGSTDLFTNPRRQPDRIRRRRRSGSVDDNDLLGAWSAIAAYVNLKPPAEIVREYLKELRNFDGFVTSHGDSLYRKFFRNVPAHVDYLVTGHTHQAKANLPLADLPMAEATSRLYFNTGTWVPLMVVPKDELDDPEKFKKLFGHLQTEGNDGLKVLKKKKYVRNTNHYAWFSLQGDNVTAQLTNHSDDAPLASS